MRVIRIIGIAAVLSASVCVSEGFAQQAAKKPPKPPVTPTPPPCNCIPGYHCVCEHKEKLYLTDEDWNWIKSISDRNKQMLKGSNPSTK